MNNPEYRKLNASQLKILKKYDQKYGDGHGHLLIKDFDGNKDYVNEHDVDEWFITVWLINRIIKKNFRFPKLFFII